MIILVRLLWREDFVEYKDLECIGLYGSDGVAVQMKSLNIFCRVTEWGVWLGNIIVQKYYQFCFNLFAALWTNYGKELIKQFTCKWCRGLNAEEGKKFNLL